jgi:hypothetical protein
MKIARLIPLALLLASGRSLAEAPMSPEPDKSGYTLFNPVPDELLRELDTDRPDKTNSPHTLDAGHFQIEVGLASFTSNEDSGVRTHSWTWVDANSRIGLTNWAELQVEVPFYQSSRSTDLASDETEHSNGIGDVSVVVKTNFWGNDQGDTAGGMEFFVKAPTAAHGLGNDEVEGGAVFLLDLQLPGAFDLGINNGVSIDANDDGGHYADFVNSASVSHTIAGPLSGYVEFFSSVPTQNSGDWEGTVDVGATLAIGGNFQLDAGLNIGVTQAADDLQPFVGASYRF